MNTFIKVSLFVLAFVFGPVIGGMFGLTGTIINLAAYGLNVSVLWHLVAIPVGGGGVLLCLHYLGTRYDIGFQPRPDFG